MKNFQKLDRAQMKKIKGGGATLVCAKYVVCTINEGMTEVPYQNICCNTLSEAQSYCYSHGYSGIYGCVDSGLA